MHLTACTAGSSAAMKLLHILLIGSVSMCFRLVTSEEPTMEGLTSTSLMELTMIPHLESLDSMEHDHVLAREAALLTSLLQAAQGSGFSSQENEESTILQSPQYFLEDGGDANETSLDLGTPTDYTFPVSSHRSVPRGNESEPGDHWESTTPQLSMDSAELVTHTSYTHALAEDDALLRMNQEDIAQDNETYVGESDAPGPRGTEDLLSYIVSSAAPGRSRVITEPAGGEDIPEERDTPKQTLGTARGTSLYPSLVPPSVIPRTTYAGFVDAPAHTSDNPTRNIIGRKHAEGTDNEEIPEKITNDPAAPVGPPSSSNVSPPGYSWETKEHHSTAQHVRKVSVATTPASAKRSETLHARGTLKAALPSESLWNSAQVICKDWSNLAGKNYIILNMSNDIDCELFRLQKGQQLLSMVEDALSRKNDRLQESWVISLSKPNENDKHLLMTLVGEQGVIPTKDVLMALGDIKRNLAEIGIQNYSTTTSCQSRPSQSRSDYGKLFVVLVIIGSICVMIIVSGLIYICWQRRLPKLKNMSRGEELHFVENGCHDNPTLDVTMDSQSEMQEKPSLNGGTLGGADSWNVLINKKEKNDPDTAEEDTHL